MLSMKLSCSFLVSFREILSKRVWSCQQIFKRRFFRKSHSLLRKSHAIKIRPRINFHAVFSQLSRNIVKTGVLMSTNNLSKFFRKSH